MQVKTARLYVPVRDAEYVPSTQRVGRVFLGAPDCADCVVQGLALDRKIRQAELVETEAFTVSTSFERTWSTPPPAADPHWEPEGP